jgi:hypothetical protein
MRSIKLVIPTAVLVAGFLVCVTPVQATHAYAKKEKKSCTFCHAKSVKDKAEMVKNLNPTGTCYKESDHSLAKCSPPPAK